MLPTWVWIVAATLFGFAEGWGVRALVEQCRKAGHQPETPERQSRPPACSSARHRLAHSEPRPVAGEDRLFAEAREFVEAADSEGFDPNDALDLIREFATHSPAPTEAGEVERLREALTKITKVQVNGWDNIWAGANRCREIATAALTSTQGGAE